MKNFSLVGCAAALTLLAGSAGAQSPDTDYLKKFDGAFNGGGKVRTAANGSPYNVKCNVSGSSTPTSVSIGGKCTAMAIVSRNISADLSISPTGVYSGTYVGSKIGPAKLTGRRQGDAVVLNVTWPKPVNGDTNATMTITQSVNGFSFAVDDLDRPGGKPVRMTDIRLTR